MKKLFFALLAVVLFSSCSTMRQSATQRDVAAPVVSAVISDLDVAPEKIFYTYVPTRQVRRGGVHNCINCAIAEALKRGDYDVLVETQQATVERKGLFGRKITKVVVTGYPAKYKNFRQADEKAVNAGIATGSLVNNAEENQTRTWGLFQYLK